MFLLCESPQSTTDLLSRDMSSSSPGFANCVRSADDDPIYLIPPGSIIIIMVHDVRDIPHCDSGVISHSAGQMVFFLFNAMELMATDYGLSLLR